MKKARSCRGAIASSNHFRHAEFGCIRCDHEIVAVDHGEAAAQAPTFDRRHGNLGKVAHDGNYFDHAAVTAADTPAMALAATHVVKISSRRIGVARTPSDNAADLIIVAERAQNVSKLFEQGDA